METLTFDINQTNISLTSYTMRAPRITGHNTDYMCVFSWSEEWNGLTLSAKFHNTATGHTDEYMLIANTCKIPYSVLAYGDLEIGLSGTDGNGVIKNSRPFLIPIDRDIGMYDADIANAPDSLPDSVIEQIANLRTEMNEIAAITERAVTDVGIQIGIDGSGDPIIQALDITDHALCLPLASDSVAGLVRGVSPSNEDAENKIVVHEDGTMSVYSLNVNRLVQDPDDEMIIGDVSDLNT